MTFHDGAAFDSADVVFSMNRAKQPTSAMKELLATVEEIRAVDAFTVELVTSAPNPILPANLTNLFIMDQGWTEANDTVNVQNRAEGEVTYAVTNANGTGPYILESREADAKTVMKANPNYWGIGQFPLEVSEIVYTPIQSSATRVAAFLSGEIDLLQEVPVQDLERIAAAPGKALRTGPENRTIFLGFNIGDADLKWDDVEGKNPFSDVRVRRAMNMAINREVIQKIVMRGQSVPTGVIVPPFVNGWTEALDKAPAVDVEGAKALLAEAGYPDGFGVTLHCPNDRYVNDEAICQAVTGMFGRIGVKTTLDARPKSIHFAELRKREVDFYMLGWGVPPFDSIYVFDFLVHTDDGELGSWNGTRSGDPAIDAKIKAIAGQTDLDKRNAMIAEVWATVQDATLYLPLHHQVLNWAMDESIDFPVQPENTPKIKYLRYN